MVAINMMCMHVLWSKLIAAGKITKVSVLCAIMLLSKDWMAGS